MAGFSTSWLKLREPADHRSRNAGLADALSARFALRDRVAVVDIGCGTGSNLRATAPLLPTRQSWTLVDYDADLLAAARVELSGWADAATTDGDLLRLRKDRLEITVEFRRADLAANLEAALGPAADLITAAAFFDLTSDAFIRDFATAVASRRAVFYTVLTYNGIGRWQPHHPADQAIAAAFHRHQLGDKGFGPAAGPTAPLVLGDRFQLAEYSVQEGDSPWQLGAADSALIAELQAGHAEAARETRSMATADIDAWAAHPRSGAVVGHTDTLAIPI